MAASEPAPRTGMGFELDGQKSTHIYTNYLERCVRLVLQALKLDRLLRFRDGGYA